MHGTKNIQHSTSVCFISIWNQGSFLTKIHILMECEKGVVDGVEITVRGLCFVLLTRREGDVVDRTVCNYTWSIREVWDTRGVSAALRSRTLWRTCVIVGECCLQGDTVRSEVTWLTWCHGASANMNSSQGPPTVGKSCRPPLTFKNRASYIYIYITGVPLPSRCCILCILFSSTISTECFKHAAHSLFFS
jgi:hypothetical protein